MVKNINSLERKTEAYYLRKEQMRVTTLSYRKGVIGPIEAGWQYLAAIVGFNTPKMKGYLKSKERENLRLHY